MNKYLFGCVLFICTAASVLADNEICFDCHNDEEFETERNGMSVSLHVEPDIFAASVHGDLDCTDCHEDANDDHEEILAPVHCADCHDDAQAEFDVSAHGRALAQQAPFAPGCSDCHGKHDILPADNPASQTFKINIPRTCGRCHREGAPVAESYDLAEHNILENYSQSIHGVGLF